MLNKTSTDSSLEKINDARLNQSVFGRIFGFGDLEILTASDIRHRPIPDDPQPDRVQEGDARRQARVRARRRRRLVRPEPAAPRASRSARPPARRAGPATVGDDDRVGEHARPRARTRQLSSDELTRTLTSLADLRDRGAISAEEYERKKADLLSRL